VWEFCNTINNRWFECRDQAIPWIDGRLVRMEIATDITEQKRFEDEYRTFIKTAKDGFWITDRTGRIVDVNEAYCRMSGYAVEEVIGRRVSDFDIDDDPYVVLEKMEMIIETGHVRFETRHRDKSGVIYDVEVSTSYLKDRDSFCAFIRDIREQKQAELDNQRLSHMLQESQHIAHIGGWEIDLADKSLYWSQETYLIHETTPQEYSPTVETAIAFYAPESVPIVSSAIKEAIEYGKDFKLELDLVTAKGNPIRAYTTSKVIRENGITTKIVGAFQDITERRRLEEQLRQSQKMEAVGQLAGGVAHDFNNILTVIAGYSSLLIMDGGLTDLQKRHVEEVAASAEKAAHLTHGLLAFSRKQTLVMKYENLNNIILHVCNFLTRIIGEDIILNTSCKAAELHIVADRGQMEQVLVNLATNARDAMSGGGALTVTSELVVLDSSFVDFHKNDVPPGAYALLTVSDTGCGICKEHLEHIFEPFFTTKEVGKGTGLGMAIVYGIIKQHNGFINVYSETSQGTTFRIYLPIQEPSGKPLLDKIKAEPPKGGNETILVAEDDPAVGRLVSMILETSGYQVILAEDGEAAVEKFMADQDKISLVLIDMIMPKKNGSEALEQIRRIRPGIKAIFSSGYTADFIQSRGGAAKGIELIVKPVQPMELLKKIRQMLDS
jgi:PAS domain S-box-containing protein